MLKMDQSSLPASNKLNENLTFIQERLNYSDDILIRSFTLQDTKGACIFLETLVDNEKLERNFFEKLRLATSNDPLEIITASNVSLKKTLDELPKALLEGKVVLFLEGQSQAIVFAASSRLERSIEEPSNEKVVRGAHEGFNESLLSNIHLIRSKVQNSALTVKFFRVGKETNTKLALVYLNTTTNQEIVKEIERRIESISADMVFSPGFAEEFLEDQPLSPFPQMLNTERPDRVMANLIDGRVTLLADGSPTALVFPVSFFSFYQSPDDYNSRFFSGSFYRIIRTISFFIAIFVPSFYIATVAFHFEVIPGDLVMQIKSSIDTVPYPPIIEALIMELTIELIREAGVRLPSPIGQTLVLSEGLSLVMLLCRQA
ncbi:spore germination protein [Anaerobacillus sp. CMMVII]|uniref:spore germination protein n=1 Tax=Anaerobacillus sp. CMMVII TaxID=2755588 RepID=UPI0028E0A2D5|nr:spore germination protein [Anaerobacillus sp. CMMVII]